MNKLWIIIQEVYRKNVKSWSFFWMVFGPILLIVGIGAVVFFVTQSEVDNSYGNITVISPNQEITEIIKNNNQMNTLNFENKSIEELKKSLIKGDIDAYFVVQEKDNIIDARLYKETTGKNIDLSKVEQALDVYQLKLLSKDIGLDEQQLSMIQTSKVKLQTINISETKEGKSVETSQDDPKIMARNGIAYFAVFVVFMFIVNYSSIISQEIANEKGSRIMEIILSSVSPAKHFYGKMIGILLVIFTQLVIYLIIYFILKFIFIDLSLLSLMNIPEFDISGFSAEIKDIVLYACLFAILGIITYSCLAGFLGSLVTKTEDVNKILSPIMLFAIAGLYIGMFAMASPNNLLVKIGSHFPLTTPFVIPFRIANDTIGNGEITIAFIVSLLFSLLCLLVASIFYKSNVLTYSDKGIINSLKKSYTLWKSERKAQQL